MQNEEPESTIATADLNPLRLPQQYLLPQPYHAEEQPADSSDTECDPIPIDLGSLFYYAALPYAHI